MNRIILALILCIGLAGCIPATYPFLQIQRTATPVERGQVNDHGSTQLAGIHNNGSMQVYINSQIHGVPDIQVLAPDRAMDAPNVTDGNDIKKDEGLSLEPYTDQGGSLHIGYGRNLTGKGITGSEAEMLFENDLAEARADLSENIFPEEWPGLPDAIKPVLINMRYQMGPGGFRGFENMIAAVRANDWPAMAMEMKNSRWAEQTPGRAVLLIKIVESVGQKDV